MHLQRPGRQGQGRASGGRAGRHAVQHHRRQRRHLDGHRGHELLAAIARPDRRLDRDRDGRPVVRRPHRPARLRQEHARLPDGHGPAEPPGDHGLRRHDSRRLHAAAPSSTSSPPFSYGEYLAGKITRRARRRSCRTQLPRRGRLRRHVHGQHDGLAIEALGMSLPYSSSIRPKIPPSSTNASAPAQGDPQPAGTDIKPRDIMTRAGVRERDGVVMALGGSTNAVLHLIAMARAVACR
jgi:hypothetical protein